MPPFKAPQIAFELSRQRLKTTRDFAKKVSGAPSRKISLRFRRLRAFCEGQRILLSGMAYEDNWSHRIKAVKIRLPDGSITQMIDVPWEKVYADLDQVFMALGHEISHLVLPIPFSIGVKVATGFKQREPLGFLQIPEEILAWMVGYPLILAVARGYFPITTYIQFAAECVGSKIKFYFKR